MLNKYQSNRERLKRCCKMNELMESWMEAGGDATLNNFYLIKWASENKFSEILEFLIKWASENGNEEMVSLLIKVGVDVTVDNNAAIKNALKNGYLRIVDRLIKAGADAHLYNSYIIHVSV